MHITSSSPRPQPAITSPSGSAILVLIALVTLLTGISEAAAAYTYTLRPAADTVAQEAFPDTNYGSLFQLPIRHTASGQGQFSFLRFTLPGFAGNITSATLHMPVTGSIQEVGYYSVTMGIPAWDEDWLTWNNWSVGSSFTYLGSQHNLQPGHKSTLLVTPWLGSPHVTFAAASGVDAAGQSFSSREGATAPTLTVVTTGNLPKCDTPSDFLEELNAIVQTGNLLYNCDYKQDLSPNFGAWNFGSENKPVIAAAIALFDGPVINGTDYRTWWQSFFAQQAASSGTGNINFFKGSELFSNVYDGSTTTGVLLARYWAHFNGHSQIRDLAGEYLRRTWFAWALAASPKRFNAIYTSEGPTRTFVRGPAGPCPTVALASPRSKTNFAGGPKRWMVARVLGYNKNCAVLEHHKPIIEYILPRYPAVTGLSNADKNALRALINSTTIPSNLASVLGAVRMKTDFHWLLWADGRRATFYLGPQLNSNIASMRGKHTVFATLFDQQPQELDLLFAIGTGNSSCLEPATGRIYVEDSMAGCPSGHWINLPSDPPTHHFVLGPGGFRTCSSLSC